MAFVPEDGTGLANANSFISVETADAYFDDRSVTKWADLDQTPKETALIQATDYIMLRWPSEKFKGWQATEGQSLPFPRIYVGNSALQMPVSLQKATAEYALLALDGPLAPNFEYDETGRLVTKKREEVGPIVEEVGYPSSTSTNPPTYRTYPVPDGLIRPLLNGSGGGVTRN